MSIDQLSQYGLGVYEFGTLIPLPIGIDAIISALNMLEELQAEDVNDLSSEFFPKNGNIINAKNWNEFQRLKIRFLNRATAYIIISCNANDILKRSYRIFADVLSSESLISCSNADVIELCKRMDSKITNLRFYRDKVLAHASFADPRKDNPALQLNSLIYFSGRIVSLTRDGFGLGSGGLQSGENDTVAPGFSILQTHPSIKGHFDNWAAEFVKFVEIVGVNRINAAFSKTRIKDKLA